MHVGTLYYTHASNYVSFDHTSQDTTQCIIDSLVNFKGEYSFDSQDPKFENTTDIDNR